MEDHKIILVDDHSLFRKGIAEIINGFDGFKVILEASDGNDLVDKMTSIKDTPSIAIVDINMKGMDGYKTTQWLRENFSDVNVLALSMYEDEGSIIGMLRAGAHGYILKDTEPNELKLALNEVVERGFYHSALVGNILHSNMFSNNKPLLNDREIEFMKLSCSELTYKEIADKMNVAIRTVDGYRDALFDKLEIKNRVGLVIYAIKHGIFQIS